VHCQRTFILFEMLAVVTSKQARLPHSFDLELLHALNPVGRVYYGASTMICTPASLSQEVGLGLGAQAGEMKLRKVALDAGFTHFRRATETPFNMVFEVRA
jgi:hypothetical protein